MRELLIEPHYFGCIEYYCLIQAYPKVCFELNDTFQKQTYRNRTYLLVSNKILPLSVPLSYSSGTKTKEVKINYSQRWLKDHWGAIYSAYGKAPYFEYFSDEYRKVLDTKPSFLVDLDLELIRLNLKLMDLMVEITFTSNYTEEKETNVFDSRNIIRPKNAFSDRNIYQPIEYTQLFGDSFVANLSIIDLIMCEGPRASEILALSYRGAGSNS